ncbi:MAG: hypothetical protein NC247_04510, partial [Ruminococcus flavefaciens]|nr:hypothetical protein [Ruminococcus flavefaciens]
RVQGQRPCWGIGEKPRKKTARERSVSSGLIVKCIPVSAERTRCKSEMRKIKYTLIKQSR